MPKKRVLFIDSDNEFVERWANIIEKFGVEVIRHQEGSTGLVLAKTYQPHLIILCLELRDINGYLVCKRLREDAGTKSMPIFITSSTATEKDFEKHKKLRVRADEYFHKPVDEKSFKEKLISFLGVQLTPETERLGESSVGPVMVDEAEVLALKDKIKSMDVDIELLRKDLEDAHNSRKELARSLGAQLENEREKVKQFQDEKESLEEQIGILKSEKQELLSIVDRVESESKENKKKVEEYSEKLSNYEKRVKELESIRTNLEEKEREKERYKNEISEFRSEIIRLKDKIVELEEIIKEKDQELSQIDPLSERAKELEERVEILRNEKEKIESELLDLRNQSSAELTTLMDQINNLAEEKAKLEKELNETKRELEQTRTLREEFERVTSDKSRLDEVLRNKDTTISKKEAIILELEQKVKSQASIIEETQQQLKEKEGMLANLNQRLLDIENKGIIAEELKERIKEIENQIAEKDEELLRYRGIADRISELELELNTTKMSEEGLRRQLSELEELRKKDEEFLNTLDSVVKEKDRLLKRVKELEEEKRELSETHNVELEQEVISLRGKISEQEQEIKNLKELIEVQMEEKSKLENELKMLRAGIGNAGDVMTTEKVREEVIELEEENKEKEKKEEVAQNELLLLDESTVVEESKDAVTEESDLVSMLENIWEEGTGQEKVVEGEKPGEEFFEESDIITADTAQKEDFSDPEAMEWKQLIDKYNSIFNLIFMKLVPEKGKEQAEAIWEEFLSEQDDKEKVIFENVHINEDGTLSQSEILKNLQKISEGGKIGQIAGLDNLYINQKLRLKLNEFIDFMIIIAKRKFNNNESENLIKAIKEKQKSIK